MDLFDYQWNSHLGSVGRTPTETGTYLEAGFYENDVYQFELEEAGDLNISLYSSPGDDADLELYRDSNDNGFLDAEDEFIAGSYNGADSEDVIDHDGATIDTYFTRVSYHDGGYDNYLDYDLSLYTEEPVEEGNLYDYTTYFDLGYVGRTPTETGTYLEQGYYENDIYQFALDEIGDLDISLHDLSTGDDADLELYHDSNSNGILDANDELVSGSYNGGDSDDSIRYDNAAVGDYFTRVYYFDGGDDGIIDYNLTLFADEPAETGDLFEPGQTNYDLGYLDRTPTERSTYLQEGVYEHDVYQFAIGETSDLDLTLHSLEAEDDADLELYHDSNANYVLDADDELVTGSYNGAGHDDVIDYDGAAAGTYFAHVDYYDGGYDGYIDYELSLAADNYVNNENRFEYQTNFDLGVVGRTPTETSLYLEEGYFENDAYQFTLEETGDLDISLYNLSAGDDADLELYRDVNDNGILDIHDEFVDGSYSSDDADESIRYEAAAAGKYFANVSYYDGGDDGLIDYSLSLSSEAEETPDGHTSAGEVLVGDAGDNTLTGTEYNDTITGGAGYDVLSGGAGDDILTGSDPDVFDSGSGELDILTGGYGADLFVLGDSHEAYYQGYGYSDYASITDFDWYEGDKIQVYGVAEDYSISEYNGGTDIYYQSELIGHVENTTDVIISEDFSFV